MTDILELEEDLSQDESYAQWQEDQDVEVPAYEDDPERIKEVWGDSNKVDRWFRRLRWILRQEKEVKARFAGPISEMETRRDEELARLRGEASFIERTLRQAARAHNSMTGQKTIKFPNGTLTARAGQINIALPDDEKSKKALKKWLKDQNLDDLISKPKPHVPEVMHGVAKKAFVSKAALDSKTGPFAVNSEGRLVHRESGEVVPGVAVVAAEDKYDMVTAAYGEAI